MDKVLPLKFIRDRVVTIDHSSTINIQELSSTLVYLGYERQALVDSPGDFSVRGGFIDIFPFTEEATYRFELWGDEIDSMRVFDVDSHRSIEQKDRLVIYPAAEIILDEDCLNKGLKRIEEEMQQYVKKQREEFKTEEAARIEGIIREFTEK